MITLAALLAAAAPQAGELKTFRDWTIGCDNGRACHATSLIEEEGDWENRTMLAVTRGGAADARPVFSLGSDDPAAALLADGKRLAVRLVQGEGGVAVDPRDQAAMLAALRSARTLEIRPAREKVGGTVSLAGLSAALLYMDEVQKRIGTVTALVRPGPRPGSDVPPPPPLPRVAAAPPSAKPPRAMPAAEVARLRKQACEDMEVEGEESDAELFRLDERHSAAIIPLRCWSGAYNMAARLLIADGDGPWRPAAFDAPSAQGGEQEEGDIVYNAAWDAKTRRLESGMKGRGLGDCGLFQQHVWDGERFRLVEQTEMGECRGSTDYITTWRAEVAGR